MGHRGYGASTANLGKKCIKRESSVVSLTPKKHIPDLIPIQWQCRSIHMTWHAMSMPMHMGLTFVLSSSFNQMLSIGSPSARESIFSCACSSRVPVRWSSSNRASLWIGRSRSFASIVGRATSDGYVNDVDLKKEKDEIVRQLKRGRNPIEVLGNLKQWQTSNFWTVVKYLEWAGRIGEVLQAFEWVKQQSWYRTSEEDFIKFMEMTDAFHMPEAAQALFNDMESHGFQASVKSKTVLLQCYANSGDFEKAEEIMDEMVKTGLRPDASTYTVLIKAYGKGGRFDEMARTFNNMKTVHCEPDIYTYSFLIQSYARGGLVARMEKVFKAMTNDGWQPHEKVLNTMVQAYSAMGMLKDMERVYGYFTRYRAAAAKETVRAVALAYIRQSFMFRLSEFVRSLPLKRKDVGNLYWNLLLLSHAASFTMKGLQRETIHMKEAGFEADLNTFNIRALAFSKMQMYWDLHVIALHMASVDVAPDLVSYGAVVDAYVAGNLQKKLWEVLDELQMFECKPEVRSDPLLFEAFGKGSFHLYCEESICKSSNGGSTLTYSTLTTLYLQRGTTQEIEHLRRKRMMKI